MAQSIINTYNEARKLLDQGPVDNLQRATDPNARAIDTAMESSRVSDSGLLQNTVTLSRRGNPLRENAYIQQITKTSYHTTITGVLAEIQTIVTDGTNPQNSRLVSAITDFYSQSNILNSDTSVPMKQAFVDKSQALAQTFTDASDKVRNLRLDVDDTMNQSATDINHTLSSLNAVNQQILRSPSPITLYDQRDKFIRDLAQNFDIRVRFGENGIAIVSLPNSGEELISGDNFAQVKYQGIRQTTGDIVQGNQTTSISLDIYKSSGEYVRSTEISNQEQGFNLITGGRWAALLELRDQILLDSAKIIQTLSGNFAKRINEIHNNGSTIPPKTKFESTATFYGNQKLELNSNFTIYAIDKSGRQLSGGAGLVNAAVIDIEDLARSSADGTVTAKDIIAEINEKLNLAPSRIRAALGVVSDKDGNPIAEQYLINNIQIAGRSDIKDGAFYFDLDLQGSSYFGSNVEILGVAGPNGALPGSELPKPFRLEKDTNSRTKDSITLNGFDPAGGPQNITLDIRVTGDNGQINRGTVTFTIDPANGAMLNKRIAFDGDAAKIAGETVASVLSHSGIAKAMLVDENGSEIDPSSGRHGKLLIETSSDDYCLVIQGGNFSSLMGFSNFFEFDPATGKMNVNPEIVANANYIATGQVEKTDGKDILVTVGDAKASAAMVFSGLLADGDTVTIDGEIFTFLAAGASGSNQVPLADGLDGLARLINNHPIISSRVLANVAGLTLNISAQAAGTSSNAITVAANLAVQTVDINGAGAANMSNGTLLGGTDKTEVIKQYEYNMGSVSTAVLKAINNTQSELIRIEKDGVIPQMIASLPNLATITTGLLSNQFNDAEVIAKVAENVLKEIDTKIKQDFGINKEEQYEKALENARYLNTLAHLMRMVQQNADQTEAILFG